MGEGISLWWGAGSLLGGNWANIWLVGGLFPIPPVGKTLKGESEIWKNNEKRKWMVSKETYIKWIKCKDPFCASSYVRSFSQWQYYILLMSYYTNFIHTIYLLKWFENDYFPKMLWLEPNRDVHCKSFAV